MPNNINFEKMIIDYAHSTPMTSVNVGCKEKYSYSLLESSAPEPEVKIQCFFYNTTRYNVENNEKNFMKAVVSQHKTLLNKIGDSKLFYMTDDNIKYALSGSLGSLRVGSNGLLESFNLVSICSNCLDIKIKRGRNKEFSKKYLMRKMVAVPCKEKLSDEVIYNLITNKSRINVGGAVRDSGLNYIFPIVLVNTPALFDSLRTDGFYWENDLCRVSFPGFYSGDDDLSWDMYDICKTAEEFEQICDENFDEDKEYTTLGDYLKQMDT